MISSALMIVGYGIIAVPTGIVTAELTRFNRLVIKRCEGCGLETHDPDAAFCKRCGASLPKP